MKERDFFCVRYSPCRVLNASLFRRDCCGTAAAAAGAVL